MSTPDTPAEAAAAGDQHSAVTYNARLGLVLFVIYLIIYGVFVALCTFALDTMGRPMLGMNVAVCYGFGLIVTAFVLAAIYLFLCRR